MQKRVFFLFSCLAIVGLFYLLGRKANPYLGPEAPLIPVSFHKPLFSSPQGGSKTVMKPSPPPLTIPGSSSLYPEMALDKETQSLLEERFKMPYKTSPEHNDQRSAYEVAERVGLLKKLFTKAERANIPEQRRFLSLYKSILLSPNEHWLVKRQALRNAAPLWSFLNEKERDKILHKVDLRARSLWRKNERELASEIVGSYEK